MIRNDFHGKAVVITGGTKGLGLAIGLAFGAEGADVFLTNRWGSADEDEVKRRFAECGAPEPRIIEADASQAAETKQLLELIKQTHEEVFVFVSNVSFAQVGPGLDKYKKRSLFKSLEYSAWPMIEHVQQINKIFGRYPRYTLATSCDGPDTYYPGYDFVAASKTVMETFCRYMAKHMFESGQKANINVLRSRPVPTESLVATFGEEFEPFLRKYHSDDYLVELEQVGEAALAMCSGLLDAMTGQVVLLDKGLAFEDNLMRMFEHRSDYGL